MPASKNDKTGKNDKAGKEDADKTKKLLGKLLANANRDPWSEHIDALLDMRSHASDMGMTRSTTVLVEELIRRICGLGCFTLPYEIPEKAVAWCRNCGLPAPYAVNKIEHAYPRMLNGGCSNCGYYDENDKDTCRKCQSTLSLPEATN